MLSLGTQDNVIGPEVAEAGSESLDSGDERCIWRDDTSDNATRYWTPSMFALSVGMSAPRAVWSGIPN